MTGSKQRLVLTKVGYHGTATNSIPTPMLQPPMKLAKIKIGTGRARGRGGSGRGRGRSQQSMVAAAETTMRIPKLVIPNCHRVGNLAQVNASSRHNFAVTPTLAVEADSDQEIWCVCQRPYEGRDMIECEFKSCPYKWYHLDCIGLAQKDVPKGKWYCNIDRCREARVKAANKRKRQHERLVGHYTQ